MAANSTTLRRTSLVLLFLVGVGAAVGAAIAWGRRQSSTPVPDAPPTWPEFTPSWQPANADGSTPPGHPIKVKESSGIFHVPGGRFYDRTRADRFYATAAAAIADGYRQSKS